MRQLRCKRSDGTYKMKIEFGELEIEEKQRIKEMLKGTLVEIERQDEGSKETTWYLQG